MRFFGWIGSLALFWILVELSFLELLLPEVNAPLVLIALILALVVTLDQQWALGWAVGITFIFDITRSGDITLLSLFFVVTAYGLFFSFSTIALYTRACESFLTQRFCFGSNGDLRNSFSCVLMATLDRSHSHFSNMVSCGVVS